MGRITHDTIKVAIERPKHTKINIKHNHTKVNVLKGTIGTPGKEGDVYIPRAENGYLIWEKVGYENSPEMVSLGVIAQSISNIEILNILNN